MAKETFKDAHARLHRELGALGHQASKATLKEPYVIVRQHGKDWRIAFKPQAVYLDAHSLFIDARGMNVRDLLREVDAAIRSRT